MIRATISMYAQTAMFCLLALCCANSCSLAYAQSSTRPIATANVARSNSTSPSSPALVAEPKPQRVSPFLPPDTSNVRMPVAVSGFCVVSLRENQQWQLCSEHHQLNFDNQLYWFASQRERAMFAAAPQRYVPALGGDCVVTWAEEKVRVRGNPQFGTLHKKKLFFFRDVEQQEKFKANPNQYANRDVANDGLCLVCQIDQQRKMPGLPQTTVIVDGMRYVFAGLDQQRKFLINMPHYGVKPPEMPLVDKSPGGPPPILTPESMVPNSSQTAKVASKPSPKKTTIEVDPAKKAMSGYCPVSIRDGGIWTLGSAKYQVQVDGQTYLMAGEDEFRRFSENPYTYLPAMGGKCVVSEVNQNKLLPGSIYHASQYEDRLYLFAGAEQKEAFKASPGSYMNADLAVEGNCIVTLIDEGQEVAGLPELLIWHRNKRYFFASTAQQAKFRENVERYQTR